MASLPVLYSFRRCPYAMRARLALCVSGQACELREVVLRDKPSELLQASAKATVPVLVDTEGQVIDESLQIMRWALARRDPEGWLTPPHGSLDEMLALIAQIDGPFKFHLDRYKYPQRYPADDTSHRAAAAAILADLQALLGDGGYLFGDRRALADMAIAPFVRQFAHVDADWFAAQAWPALQAWLSAFEASDLLAGVMQKYRPWHAGSAGIRFG